MTHLRQPGFKDLVQINNKHYQQMWNKNWIHRTLQADWPDSVCNEHPATVAKKQRRSAAAVPWLICCQTLNDCSSRRGSRSSQRESTNLMDNVVWEKIRRERKQNPSLCYNESSSMAKNATQQQNNIKQALQMYFTAIMVFSIRMGFAKVASLMIKV